MIKNLLTWLCPLVLKFDISGVTAQPLGTGLGWRQRTKSEFITWQPKGRSDVLQGSPYFRKTQNFPYSLYTKAESRAMVVPLVVTKAQQWHEGSSGVKIRNFLLNSLELLSWHGIKDLSRVFPIPPKHWEDKLLMVTPRLSYTWANIAEALRYGLGLVSWSWDV